LDHLREVAVADAGGLRYGPLAAVVDVGGGLRHVAGAAIVGADPIADGAVQAVVERLGVGAGGGRGAFVLSAIVVIESSGVVVGAGRTEGDAGGVGDAGQTKIRILKRKLAGAIGHVAGKRLDVGDRFGPVGRAAGDVRRRGHGQRFGVAAGAVLAVDLGRAGG